MSYEDFIKSKEFKIINKSVEVQRDDLNENLFEYQKDLVYLALKKGKFALFAMTGTGKTAMQCEWAYRVNQFTNKPVLILAPLSVASQTVNEAKVILDLNVTLCESQEDITSGVNITNYEKLHKFDLSVFSGIVLDESSILKSFTGKVRNQIVEGFARTKFKLACSATPAPNDFVELGNHVEFLNVCRSPEMLSLFFINDVMGEEGKWRLKKHAEDKFWEWVAKWSAVFTKPSDLGYSEDEDKKYQLPNKFTFEHVVKSKAAAGLLFAVDATDLNSRRQARRETLEERCQLVADLVNNSNDIWIVWCDLNAESEMLKKLINNSVEVKGSDKDNHKVNTAINFAKGEIKCLIAKPSMFGAGLNFQVCHNMAFVGLSDSFEQVFQATRRCYRFGQKNDVNVHIVTSEAEGNVKKNQDRKEKQFLQMIDELVKHTKQVTLKELKAINVDNEDYQPQIKMILPKFI
ncbi:MAG: DEAD/DEAH box helicase [Arcobacteraceae bacterium]